MQRQNPLNDSDTENFYDCVETVGKDQSENLLRLSENCSKLDIDNSSQTNNNDVDLDVPETSQLSEEEKQQLKTEALSLKEKGNLEFKKQLYAEAEALYSEGLRICPDCFLEERSVLYSNRSACLMYLKKLEEAIIDCSEAIKLNQTYLKPLLRRAQLYEESEKLDEAFEDYKLVLEIDPSNQKAKSACSNLPTLIKERNEKLKAEMMGTLKDFGNKILGKFGLSTDNFQMQENPETGSYNIQFKQNP